MHHIVTSKVLQANFSSYNRENSTKTQHIYNRILCLSINDLTSTVRYTFEPQQQTSTGLAIDRGGGVGQERRPCTVPLHQKRSQ
jgi:hypothetical protein